MIPALGLYGLGSLQNNVFPDYYKNPEFYKFFSRN